MNILLGLVLLSAGTIAAVQPAAAPVHVNRGCETICNSPAPGPETVVRFADPSGLSIPAGTLDEQNAPPAAVENSKNDGADQVWLVTPEDLKALENRLSTAGKIEPDDNGGAHISLKYESGGMRQYVVAITKGVQTASGFMNFYQEDWTKDDQANDRVDQWIIQSFGGVVFSASHLVRTMNDGRELNETLLHAGTEEVAAVVKSIVGNCLAAPPQAQPRRRGKTKVI
jgi:hypothetical protein